MNMEEIKFIFLNCGDYYIIYMFDNKLLNYYII